MSDLRLAVQGAKEPSDHLWNQTKPAGDRLWIYQSKSFFKKGSAGFSRVECFVEKPDLETAKAYLSDGSYFWNSGIFVWKTSKILSEIEKHLPALYETLKEIEGLFFNQLNPINTINSTNPLRSQRSR